MRMTSDLNHPMTETKQDIQAQIDQSDVEWSKETLSYKKTSAMGRLPKRVSRWGMISTFLVGPTVCLALLFLYVGDSWEAGDIGDKIVLSIFIYLLPVGGWQICERKHKFGRYSQALDEYESKRAELQAKLDALD